MRNAQDLSDAIDLLDDVSNSAALCSPERNKLSDARALIAHVHLRLAQAASITPITEAQVRHELRNFPK